MYFSGRLEVDPAQITVIDRVKPQDPFGKLFFFMTGGALSSKEEQETFTAISILQQLQMALASMGINNIVRLAKDDIDFYLDEVGREDDLAASLERFRLETDRFESELFESLYLVVEHQAGQFRYLIEIEIDRIHKVGAYPIKLTVNGVMTEFAMRPEESVEDVRKRMMTCFANQEAYDAFQIQKQAAFNLFMDQLELALKKAIRVDNVHKHADARIVRPRRPASSPENVPTERHGPPVFQGYHGFDSFFLYAFLWSAMSHDHHIHYHNVAVVDEVGSEVFTVGDGGFNAGESDTMNPEADFVPPEGGDIDYASDHAFDDELRHAGLGGFDDTAGSMSDSGDSWLDFGDGFDFDISDFSDW